MTIAFYINPDPAAVVVHPATLVYGIPDGYTPVTYQGETLYAYPFDVENVQALRAVGVGVPSPIGSAYRYPPVDGRHPAGEHQRRTAAFFTLHQRCYCLNEIGTGKTYSALWAADYLMQAGYVRRAMIISPLSTLTPVWANSLYRTFSHRTFAVLHADAAKRRKMFQAPKDFYIVNHDGLKLLTENTYNAKKQLVKAQLLRDDIDLFIFDELAVYRNSNNDRWEHVNAVLQRFPNAWIWGMTGTPTPESPADAYSQVKLVTPHRVPRYYSAFKQSVMQQVSDFIWRERADAMETVFAAMQPAIRISRSEAYDLPPTIYSDREAELSSEQEKHYREMFNQCVTQFKAGEIVTAVNEGVKIGKLLQIAGGVVYSREGEPVLVDAKPRLRVLLEIIEQAGQKVIVYVPYRPILEWLYSEVRKRYSAAMVHGGVSKGERDRIYAAFQREKEPRVILADAGCMSHGLTLTEASTTVWYGPELSNDTYTQANGRTTRLGQRNVTNVIHIASTPLERKLFKRLQERGSLQGVLLDMIKEASR